MPQPTETTPVNLGFLTVLRDVNGFLGGYLVTSRWGRPLEFRLTTAVQPNRVQQILYGDTLERYLCGELIGKALFEKTATPVQFVLTDKEAALDLRRHVGVSLAWLPPSSEAKPAAGNDGGFVCHREFPDEQNVRELLEQLDPSFDLAEPFARIREAIAEARKMGVTNRAA